jgi:membrane-associated protein
MGDWAQAIKHLDENLGPLIRDYGPVVYGILFLATFAKTGLIYAPLVPTTTLAFAAGAFSSPFLHRGLNIFVVLPLVILGAWTGDMANYWWGHALGPKLANVKRLKMKWLEKGNLAYEQYGLNALLFGRWVSGLRNVLPLIAGSSRVPFWKFALGSLVACALWSIVLVGAGFALGQSDNPKMVLRVLAGIVMVALGGPLLVKVLRSRRQAAANNAA